MNLSHKICLTLLNLITGCAFGPLQPGSDPQSQAWPDRRWDLPTHHSDGDAEGAGQWPNHIQLQLTRLQHRWEQSDRTLCPCPPGCSAMECEEKLCSIVWVIGNMGHVLIQFLFFWQVESHEDISVESLSLFYLLEPCIGTIFTTSQHHRDLKTNTHPDI